jgi:arylsulfatase A
VAAIISWPSGFETKGIKRGAVNAEPIIGSDVFPTILDIADIDLPQSRVLDGISILLSIHGKQLN